MKRFVGLDVHKRVVEACIVDMQGEVVQRERFALNRNTLHLFATKFLTGDDQVVLEATTNTWAVVRILRPLVGKVVVSNPLQTKAIASAKVKTDKVDAFVLAQLLRCNFLPQVWIPDEETQVLRGLTSRRASLVGDRTRIKNRLHSVLAHRLIQAPMNDLFGKKGLPWLRSLELDDDGRYLINSDLRLLESVEKEIEELDKMLARRGYEDPRVKIVMTLPGVDVAVALTILSVIGDIKRFRSADHVASYFGLVPSTRQSASKCYHGPITKAGNGQGRWMLIQAAQHLRCHPGPLGVFFRRLANKKNYNVAVTATARKMVVLVWHMLTNNEPYRYAQPDPTQRKLARFRINVTGERRKRGRRPGVKGPRGTNGEQVRTIKPLAQIYQEEGVPPLRRPPKGESKLTAEANFDAFLRTLEQGQVVPLYKNKKQTNTKR